ncbi:aurora kinase A- and ninein-interacting protein isoform X2 [Rhineura floridana]|uniref:aurora kinase A- and ninein-interacting protein isoform X2 n=1 Tax=Rhineura floridana TaxID=261503 RepID=UPI002AC80764|nr:aurora kinase A- and ninein-interacting protein isoform X2 [Rhineura floridana]
MFSEKRQRLTGIGRILQEEPHHLNTEDKLLMKQKAKSPAEKQQESCGIWLDTSALKRHKIQTVIAKPALILNQLSRCPLPTRAPLPCMKQTTISAFFSTQQAGGRNTSPNKRPLAAASSSASKLKSHELSGVERALLAASLLQPRVMQEHKQLLQGLHSSPCNAALAAAQANSSERRDSVSETENPLSSDFIQHLEEKRELDHITVSDSPVREKNGGWQTEKRTISFLQSGQNLTVVSNRKTKGQRRLRHPSSCDRALVDSSDSENINPQFERSTTGVKPLKSFNKSVAGLCSKTICNSDKRSEDSQVGLVSLPLFTQDSEGHKVISHRFFHERSKTPMQKKLCDKTDSATSSSYSDRFRACCTAARGTHLSPGVSMSVPADSSEESCYDLLFTQDSEGNRVIKH